MLIKLPSTPYINYNDLAVSLAASFSHEKVLGYGTRRLISSQKVLDRRFIPFTNVSFRSILMKQLSNCAFSNEFITVVKRPTVAVVGGGGGGGATGVEEGSTRWAWLKV